MSDFEDSDYNVNSDEKELEEEEEEEEEDEYVNDNDEEIDEEYDDYKSEEVIPSKRLKLDSKGENENNENKSASKLIAESYSSTGMGIGAKILEKLGHTHGQGLGRYGQGITEAPKASNQKDRRGFGYHPKEADHDRVVDPEEEQISLHEEVFWLENPYPNGVSRKELYKFMVEKLGPEKLLIDDEIEFCDPEILHGVIEAKNNLEDFNHVKKTRSRANPFEVIRNGIFLNRAAMKMANMEKVFDYMFTNPKDKNGREITGMYDLLYFADVCAGPGGFSEYIFYRKKWRAKGFGFTLKKENDFKLDEFFAGPCETFEPHYGVSIEGDTGDGDIFKTENIEEFSKFVMENTDGEGVHFMMADGGFGTNEKLIQEIVSKQLYLCQCLVALKIVRTNGNFVVKLFDIFTPFSVGLIYLMYRSFDRISIHKPNTSRPANSERYLICQYKRKESAEVGDYLTRMNEILRVRSSTNRDVLELVPMNVLKEDENFFKYIVDSNNRMGRRQIFHLKNIIYYADRLDLTDNRQEKYKEECLREWDIPNVARTDRKKGEPNRKIQELFQRDSTNFLSERAKRISSTTDLKAAVECRDLDWYWMVVENQELNGSLRFYLGLGRTNVYSLEGEKWRKVEKFSNFQLPDGTLVYGEIVQENVYNSANFKGQYRVQAFHIVDGLFLGGEDIRHKHISERRKCCEIFAKALSHSKMIYRVKTLYEYKDLYEVLSSFLSLRTLKNKNRAFGFDIKDDRFIIPGGLLFFCGSKDGWCRCKSSSRENEFYFFHKSKKLSYWESVLFPSKECSKELPNPSIYHSICSDFKECFTKRLAWWLKESDFAVWTDK